MIGHKIKNIQELKKNLTPRNMAKRLNISQATYCKLNKIDIKINEIIRINPKNLALYKY